MKPLLICFLLVFTLVGYAAESSVINVNTGQTQFTLSLPANPTTGYEWTVEQYDRSFLTLLSSHYGAAKTTLMGSGGQTQFSFELLKGKPLPESTTLIFRYSRPWEGLETGSLKRVKVNFMK